ncbi:MAG: hypothetical protein ACQKBU_07880 [Verrucomicrobiales bacterium]
MPDLAPYSTELASFFVIVGALLFIYNQARAAMGKTKLPQPLEISLSRRFVERGDHDKEIASIDARLTAAAASRKKTHERLDVVETEVARLGEQNRAQTDSLNLLSSDFRDFTREQRHANTEILKEVRKS